MAKNPTDWSVSTDIYNIVGTIDNLKKRYIEDEDETTLALGIFGFIGDTEAKKIQTAVFMGGELGNEMFPQRAKLDKNVVTHAIYSNINGLNAVPSHMTINLSIKTSDFEELSSDGKLILDDMTAIYIGEEYEFHLDYPIIISRNKVSKQEDAAWIYTAKYDMSRKNNISDINNPYLIQPYTAIISNELYLVLQTEVHQVTIEKTRDKMITNSIIDNKSFIFDYDNQLATFDVYINEGNKTVRLKPYLYGDSLDIGEKYYCWYLPINNNTIRIGFDPASYLPGINAEVEVVAQSTLGSKGNFNYTITPDSEEVGEDNPYGFYTEFKLLSNQYKTSLALITPLTPAADGSDKKSIEELQGLIPKMALSRGYITTETDLNNYFNLISTDENRLKLQKKVDNQISRVWYCYLLMKDVDNNIIPTNTLPIKFDNVSGYTKPCDEDYRWVIPAGSTFKYDHSTGYAVPVSKDEIPDPFTDEYFNHNQIYYYRIPYDIVLNTNPLYTCYYFTLCDDNSFFEYEYLNPNLYFGFMVKNNNLFRGLLHDNDTYKFTFRMQQSIVSEELGLYITESDGSQVTVVNNMKVFLVLYNGDNEPYRYAEARLTAWDNENFVSSWEVDLITDNLYDLEGRLKLLDLKEAGYTTSNYGFFPENVSCRIFCYAKLDEEYGRYYADDIIPGMEGYSLVNIYKVHNGIHLFHDYSNVMNSRVRQNKSYDGINTTYDITGVPMIGEHYFMSEDNVTYFVHELEKKKSYIDYCLKVLEHTMDVDYKYFNTYGYSETFTLGDDGQDTSIVNLDLTMKFRMKLYNNNDVTTKQKVINYIKQYIEDLNDTEGLDINNLLHDIKDEFSELISYIDYINFNDNELGLNHIKLKEIQDPHTVPEFISIRNRYNIDKTALEPCIDIEIVPN